MNQGDLSRAENTNLRIKGLLKLIFLPRIKMVVQKLTGWNRALLEPRERTQIDRQHPFIISRVKASIRIGRLLPKM